MCRLCLSSAAVWAGGWGQGGCYDTPIAAGLAHQAWEPVTQRWWQLAARDGEGGGGGVGDLGECNRVSKEPAQTRWGRAHHGSSLFLNRNMAWQCSAQNPVSPEEKGRHTHAHAKKLKKSVGLVEGGRGR